MTIQEIETALKMQGLPASVGIVDETGVTFVVYKDPSLVITLMFPRGAQGLITYCNLLEEEALTKYDRGGIFPTLQNFSPTEVPRVLERVNEIRFPAPTETEQGEQGTEV